METSSVHTSVVIEVASQEDPEDQNTYQIDLNEMDIQKDYVLDQVFCGEDVTVYALLEVPEGTSKISDEKTDGSHPNRERFRLFNSSYKNLHEKRDSLGRGKQSFESESDSSYLPQNGGNESLYCLKHVSRNYEMLSSEYESADLKVLYSKASVPKAQKSTKFKAISKGVNTDIVQSPRIIQEIQKSVKLNLPIPKPKKASHKVDSLSSSEPSYEVIEMEMRPSYSSLSSYDDSRKYKNSIPNFFIVPLIMMEDGVLSHFPNDDKLPKQEEDIWKNDEQKESESATETVPAGSEDDDKFLVMQQKSTSVGASQVQFRSRTVEEKGTKNNIMTEIKELQGKLNYLIASMESSGFANKVNEIADKEKAQKEDVGNVSIQQKENISVKESPTEISKTSDAPLVEPELVLEQERELEREEEPKKEPEPEKEEEPEPIKRNWKNLDEIPILSTFSYPEYHSSRKPEPVVDKEEKADSIPVDMEKSISAVSLTNEEEPEMQSLSKTEIGRNVEKSEGRLTDIGVELISASRNWKSAGLSKSETNLPLDSKSNFINGLKKSFSFHSKDERLEMTCLKKIKHGLFKIDLVPDMRIHQKSNMKCEMGDEAIRPKRTSQVDLYGLTQGIGKLNSDKTSLISVRNTQDDEGDAKIPFSKQTDLLQPVPPQLGDIQIQFNNPENPQLFGDVDQESVSEKTQPLKTKPKNIDPPTKAVDVEKPPSPGSRKAGSTSQNVKKERKPIKKPNKIKTEKSPKVEMNQSVLQEAIKQKFLTGSRKFTIRGNAESKLHVDRLMKQCATVGKVISVEKPPVVKGDRSYRYSKKEPHEPSSDFYETKEKKEKAIKVISFTTLSKKPTKKNSDVLLEHPTKPIHSNSVKASPPLNESGVVVELLSKKPDLSCCGSLMEDLVPVKENAKVEVVNEGSLNLDKQGVKSVWALTKVLLFEDGSKKIEILEASLNPPGYFMPKNTTNDCNFLNL